MHFACSARLVKIGERMIPVDRNFSAFFLILASSRYPSRVMCCRIRTARDTGRLPQECLNADPFIRGTAKGSALDELRVNWWRWMDNGETHESAGRRCHNPWRSEAEENCDGRAHCMSSFGFRLLLRSSGLLVWLLGNWATS